jgi:uncharacterized protein (TIGR02145 family)
LLEFLLKTRKNKLKILEITNCKSNMKKQSILILLFSIPFLGISQLFTPGAGVTDIDGNSYQTIIINGQEWMSENLRTSKYANGDSIPNITDGAQWSNLTTGAWAHYNYDSQYENPYGKLYNGYIISDPRNVCPTDWHISTDAEYSLLSDYLGGQGVAGGKMKSIDSQYWSGLNLYATNESGFSGRPGGMMYPLGTSEGLGEIGNWWSSTDTNSTYFIRTVFYYNEFLNRIPCPKGCGHSIRCLKNITSDVSEIKPLSKTLIKVFNVMGIETPICPNELQFYLYSDGSIEKKMVIEK